ncbi:MAG: hypothetical protein GY719_27720 [bacterium]|nr:hypothetical protein [bacterium]
MIRQAEALLALVDILASHRPELVPFVLDMAQNSPSQFAVIELAEAFGVDHEDLDKVLLQAVGELNQLERRPMWRLPRGAVALGGLLRLARARLRHGAQVKDRARLEALAGRLHRAHEREKTRTWLEDFLESLPARTATST